MNQKHAINPKHTFTNVRELAEWAAEYYKDQCAYAFRENPHDKEPTRVTFSEFVNDVRALATEMLSMGCAGKHCVLIGKLSYEWILTYYATLSIGAVLVPLDRDWTAEDLADTVQKANGDFLFGDEDISEKLDCILSKHPLQAEPIYLAAKQHNRTLRSLIEAGRVKFAADSAPYYNTPINPLKMSLLVFTSGTTGKGKGVMLSQNAILTDMYNVLHYLDYGKKTVGVLPPHHTYGSTIMFVAHVMIGCEVYISSGIRYIIKELSEQKPEHLVLVPLYLETFYRKILASLKDKGKYDLVFKMIKVCKILRKLGIDPRKKIFAEIHAAFGGNVKTVICGGAPLSREILDFYDGIGISVLNGYGITECAPLISVNHSKHNVLGSVGYVIDTAEVKIDEPNEDGEGEILFRGDNVMLGYYNDDEATSDAFKEGFFRTGDYGKLTKEGILYITGRKKNLIILSNGKNVYPEEIENELAATPGILDVVVYEGQSKRGMMHNAIVAEVYPDQEYFKKNGIADIHAYLKPFVDEYNQRAVVYKKIGILKVREEEFPKNTLRKIMRFKLDTSIE